MFHTLCVDCVHTDAPACSDAPTPKPRGVRTSVLASTTTTTTTANSVASVPQTLTSRVESIPEEDMYGGPVTNVSEGEREGRGSGREGGGGIGVYILVHVL